MGLDVHLLEQLKLMSRLSEAPAPQAVISLDPDHFKA